MEICKLFDQTYNLLTITTGQLQLRHSLNYTCLVFVWTSLVHSAAQISSSCRQCISASSNQQSLTYETLSHIFALTFPLSLEIVATFFSLKPYFSLLTHWHTFINWWPTYLTVVWKVGRRGIVHSSSLSPRLPLSALMRAFLFTQHCPPLPLHWVATPELVIDCLCRALLHCFSTPFVRPRKETLSGAAGSELLTLSLFFSCTCM